MFLAADTLRKTWNRRNAFEALRAEDPAAARGPVQIRPKPPRVSQT